MISSGRRDSIWVRPSDFIRKVLDAQPVSVGTITDSQYRQRVELTNFDPALICDLL